MTAPIILSTSNFQLTGKTRNTLSINIPGTIFVLFKMSTCSGSKAITPIFYQISGEEKRLKYGILDVQEYPRVALMARDTTLQIMDVPTLVLFSNHIPYAKFNGRHNHPSIKSFLAKRLNLLQQDMGMPSSSVPVTYQQRPFFQNQQPGYPQPSSYGGGMPSQNYPSSSIQTGGYNYQNPGRGGHNPHQGSKYNTQLNQVEEDDDPKLAMPEGFTPHNKPWEAYEHDM